MNGQEQERQELTHKRTRKTRSYLGRLSLFLASPFFFYLIDFYTYLGLVISGTWLAIVSMEDVKEGYSTPLDIVPLIRWEEWLLLAFLVLHVCNQFLEFQYFYVATRNIYQAVKEFLADRQREDSPAMRAPACQSPAVRAAFDMSTRLMGQCC